MTAVNKGNTVCAQGDWDMVLSKRFYDRIEKAEAVCYLNDQGTSFGGGTFRFQEGQPQAVVPISGRIVAYSSGEENTHSVDPVTRGERITLALWFTTDPEHSKDAVLLPQLHSALERALFSAPGGSFHASVPFPVDPPDTFFIEPAAWSRKSGAESAEVDSKLEEARKASPVFGATEKGVLNIAGEEQATSLKRGFSDGVPDGGAKRQRIGEVSKVSDSKSGATVAGDVKRTLLGRNCTSSETGRKDLRCQRLQELGLRFVHDSIPELEEGPSVGEEPKLGSARMAAGDQGATDTVLVDEVGNAPINSKSLERAESSGVRVASSGHSWCRSHNGDKGWGRGVTGSERNGCVRLQWSDGEAFEQIFHSKSHALQVLHHFVECVEVLSPTLVTSPFQGAFSLTCSQTTHNSKLPFLVTSGSLRQSLGHGQEAVRHWEESTRLKWQHLQSSLNRWTTLGFCQDDSFDGKA